jgi:hypothetical protein
MVTLSMVVKDLSQLLAVVEFDIAGRKSGRAALDGQRRAAVSTFSFPHWLFHIFFAPLFFPASPFPA